jgi:hypothetical protein
MATATLKFTQTNKSYLGDTTQDLVTFYGTVTFSAAADVYLTGGIAPLAGSAFKNLGPYADRAPLEVRVYSQNGQGWKYLWNVTTSKLMIFSGGASGAATTGDVELSNNTGLNATTPTISTDIVTFAAVFPRSIS